MARKCAFLDIDATAFKKLILSNVGSEEGGGARQPGFPNAADKEDLYAKVRNLFTPLLQISGALHYSIITHFHCFHDRFAKIGKNGSELLFLQARQIFETLHILTKFWPDLS